MTECTYWSAHTDSAAYSYRYDAFNNVSEYIKSTARTKYKELYFYCYTPSFPDPNKAGNNPAVQSVIVNPNTGHAVFTLFLPVPSNISGVIYTLSGREVARFGGDKTYSRGVPRILWNGQSDNNRPVSSGVYFYSLTTGAVSLRDYWEQQEDDDFDWIVQSGPTPSQQYESTGPTGDHTSGNGNYVYVEASTPNNPSKKTNMLSPVFDFGYLKKPSLTFWAHMKSDSNTMGDLYVDICEDGTWKELLA